MQALSVRLSEQEGRAQTKLEKKQDTFFLSAGKQQLSQSNKQLNDVR